MKTIFKYKITSPIMPDMVVAEYELLEPVDNVIVSKELTKDEALEIIDEFDLIHITRNNNGTIWEQEKNFLKNFIKNQEIQFEPWEY